MVQFDYSGEKRICLTWTKGDHYAELGLYRNGDDIPGDLLKLEGHTGSGRLYCHMYGEGHYPVDVEQSFVWSA